MKKLEKILLVVLLLMFGASSIFAQSSTEKVVGTVSGSITAGEYYDLYKNSADSFRDYLSGWKYVDDKDTRVYYEYSQIYEKCLAEAKKQYGSYYPNLYLKNVNYDFKEYELPDEEYHSQVIGSSTVYKKKNRKQLVYTYSATVVVSQY